MTRKGWNLEVTRPLKWVRSPKGDARGVERLDAVVEKAVGVRCWASGAGFGGRDMSFDLPDHDAAVAAGMRAKQALAALGIECEFEVWEDT